MEHSLLRHGFVLILLGLLSGLVVPVLEISRLALSAHTIGVFGGIVLLLLGILWPKFELSQGRKRLLGISWLVSGYLNWGACLLGAALGTGKMTPLASGGAMSSPLAEAVVAGLLVLVAVSSLLGAGLAIQGLRRVQG